MILMLMLIQPTLTIMLMKASNKSILLVLHTYHCLIKMTFDAAGQGVTKSQDVLVFIFAQFMVAFK